MWLMSGNNSEIAKLAKFIQNTYAYILLMGFYLSKLYDIHDPISGQTFMGFVKRRFDKDYQAKLAADVRDLMPELEVGSAVYNSLELISEHYRDNILPALKGSC